MPMMIVDFINVGYGDAILIREKNDHVNDFTALVDCGDVNPSFNKQTSRVSAAEFLEKENITHLDLLVLTHLHLDHVGGLEDIVKRVELSDCWVNYIPDRAFWGKTFPVPENASEGAKRLVEAANIYSSVLCRLSLSGARIHCLNGETSFTTAAASYRLFTADSKYYPRQQEILNRLFSGEVCLMELEELHGFINDTCLCTSFDYAGRTFALTSDIRARLLPELPCSVFKVPHHGHSDSMTPELAQALGADHAVISVSDDRKDNCPDGKIIKMLTDRGAKVWITDGRDSSSIHFTVEANGHISCAQYHPSF